MARIKDLTEVGFMAEFKSHRLGAAISLLLASHTTGGKVDCTRPLCAYPQVAKYKGTGSTDDAANFECVKPEAR